MNSIKLTDTTINRLPFAEKSKRIRYAFENKPYLILRVSNTSKVFYYYRKLKGKNNPLQVKLGTYPQMNAAAAEKAWRNKTQDIAEGKDSSRNNKTFSEVFEKYYEKHLVVNTKKYKAVRRYHDNYMNSLHKKMIEDITRENIIDLKNYITLNNGSYIANRVTQYIRAMWNWAIDNNIIDCDNPAARIKLNDEYARRRYLRKHEINTFFEALEYAPISEDKRVIIKCLLFIGQREQLTFSMKKSDLDLKDQLWIIPERLEKNGEPFEAVLVDVIVVILREWLNSSPAGSIFVFPAESKSGHVEDIRKAWEQVKKTANDPERLILCKKYHMQMQNCTDTWEKYKLLDKQYKDLKQLDRKNQDNIKSAYSDLRMHDLRRTLGSWQVELGSTLQVVGGSLGHKDTATTEKHYGHLSKSPVRTSQNRAVNAMLNTGKRENLSPIEELKRQIIEIDASDVSEFKKKILEKLML